MNDTDKIVAAIEEAKRQIVQSIAWEIFRASLFLACVMAIVTILASVAKAAPLLPPPPEPKPLQYWHTTHIPTDGGVYSLEVYAPALPPPIHQPQIVDIGDPPAPPVHVPEPGTWWIAGTGVGSNNEHFRSFFF